MSPDEITIHNYQTFFGIATRNLHQAMKLAEKRKARSKVCEEREMTDDDVDFFCAINAAINRHSMIAIIFSVMTLESFINGYGIENMSANYINEYLDKLELKSKWLIYPKLVTGKEIGRDCRAFSFLVELVGLRNRLIHDRPRRKQTNDIKDEEWLLKESNAERSLNTVRELVTELANLDESVDIEWLDKGDDPFI